MGNLLYDNTVAVIYNAGAITKTDSQQKQLATIVRLLADDIKAVLVTAAYAFDPTHNYLSDIATGTDISIVSGARSNASGVLSGRALTPAYPGVIFSADLTSFTVPAGQVYTAVVIFKDSLDVTTSRLLAYIDTGVVGMPFPADGNEVDLDWGAGSGNIIRV